MSFEQEKDEQVSKHGTPERNSGGFGYLIIPKDISRNKYINNCKEQGTVSFLTDNAEKIDNVRVSKHLWNDLDFPPTSNQLGSCIAWINIPKSNYPIIVGVIPKNDETISTGEFEFGLRRYLEGAGLVQILGNAKNKSLLIQVNSLTENDGEIVVKVKNKNKTGKLTVESDGDITLIGNNNVKLISKGTISLNIKGDKQQNTIIEYIKGEGFQYKDEFGNQIIIDEDGLMRFRANKITLGQGSNPMILGNMLKELLDDLIKTISQSTTTTALGAQPLLNALEIAGYLKRTKDILSDISYTD